MTITRGLKISETAKVAGVNPQTLRFYERVGLLPKPKRTQAGHRLYSRATIEAVLLIKRAQALGFALKEMPQLLRFLDKQSDDCSQLHNVLESKAEKIDRMIRDLQKTLRTLRKLLGSCSKHRNMLACMIWQQLVSSERGK
jgi:MerR family mercuric resistance operon transcriptional regulator